MCQDSRTCFTANIAKVDAKTFKVKIRAKKVAKTIEQIYEEALREIKSASNIESIKTLSIRYLGRKGVITHFLRNISNLPLEKRADVG
ncbi:MAG: hypothetical protein KKB23_06385, partial [Proteobacteria bacterium]|nr:hypothetical protein [Pseudomonadota bacterium]